MKLGIILGGMSTEHDISILSYEGIINNINKSKYEIYSIYISNEGKYYNYETNEEITNIVNYLKKMDVVFPILHGKYGEDGTIQGLLELLNIPYVGCKVLSSSLCMDKDYTKRILKSVNINVVDSICLLKNNKDYIYIDESFNYVNISKKDLITLVKNKLNFPVFIKPVNSGSSVGVYKVVNENDLLEYVNNAFKYDKKVLIEKEIIGREVEIAIYGNNDIIVSNPGEILKNDYYSYEAKYVNSVKTKIPANLEKNQINILKEIAIKSYHACSCSGLARIDFFIENNKNKIYVNEINTMPGFTSISMYPQLMENIGIDYSKLIDLLIDDALNNK